MAVTIPSGCYRQPTESVGKDTSGNDTFTYVLKGGYEALETLLKSLSNGDEIVSGWVMSSANLARNPGDTGTLTITCAPDVDAASETPSATSTKALKEVWQIRSIRNDVSIMAYCGPSEGQNPQREIIEAWMKEPDGTLAAANKYTKTDGTVCTIGDGQYAACLPLMNKIRKGIDSVMRFYPQLTKTRTYSKPPATVYENLACIDTPAIGTSTAELVKKPGNLAAIIEAHTWLKCQDDCTEQTDGKWTRTESWIGILDGADGSSGWDENLYGTGSTRWDMPYSHTSS